jgi:hypothetical protein
MDEEGFYRKIYRKAWDGGSFASLPPAPPSARFLWFWLLSGSESTNVPGCLRFGPAAAAEILGWTVAEFLRCFSELEQRGMAKADWTHRLVWLPSAIKYNRPANQNATKSWSTWIANAPKCPLLNEIIESLRGGTPELDRRGLPWRDLLPETVTATVPETVEATVLGTVAGTSESREQRAESREEDISRASDEAPEHVSGETDSQKARAGEEDAPTRSAIEGIYEHYLSVMGLTSQLYRLTPRRRQKIRTRLTEYEPAYLKAAITACRESDFHMGSNPGGRLYNDLARHILPSEEKVEWWVVGRNGKKGG